ncbi:hypothetical protein JXA80_02335 [bacterium]|nr:hypothetical protein [candidate division CSSED10-310 bacterium]
MPLSCSSQMKVKAIQLFFEDPNTVCSNDVRDYWMSMDCDDTVEVEITEINLSTTEMIMNTGERSYEMLEEGELPPVLMCQNLFSDAWKDNTNLVMFKMKELS